MLEPDDYRLERNLTISTIAAVSTQQYFSNFAELFVIDARGHRGTDVLERPGPEHVRMVVILLRDISEIDYPLDDRQERRLQIREKRGPIA